MKKHYTLVLITIALIFTSCEKDEEKIFDCLGQSFFIDIHHSVPESNPRQVNFNATYSGSQTLDNTIRWNFGDESPVQAVSGLTTSHIYANAGTYRTKGTVTLNNGGCSYDVEETVTVQ